MKINIDRPPIMAERAVSCDKESYPISAEKLAFLHAVKLSADQTPTIPLRRSWNMEETSKTLKKPDQMEDEGSADDDSIFSDITDPSAFGSWNTLPFDSSSNSSSFSYLDSSKRQEVLDVSQRVEALGLLDEEKGNCDSFLDLFVKSSSKDRAAFATDCNDTPPQLAQRMYSSMDWTVDSEPMNDRFEGISPDAEDKPMALPKPSYSQKESLAKLAERFRSGCAVCTHTYHLKKYPNTFVGSEAVDFMLSVNLASTREDAVFLGQQFCKDLNLFHHVCWDHTFKDGHFFYIFNDDSAKNARCITPISRRELATLSEKFVEGMPLSKHMSSRFKSYSNTFSGEEAVDYMIQSKLASNRPTAVFLGQRMMEDLDIFESVAHKSRFKDCYHLYRFVTADDTDDSYTDESASMMSQKKGVVDQHHQYIPVSPLPTVKKTLSSAFAHATVGKRKNLGVSFGLVQSRHFERQPECNPATTSGPSLGLGWRFYDDSPVPLKDETTEALKLRFGRVSVQDRTQILKEWGYSKADINRAVRSIKIVRQQRKRSLNKDTRGWH